MFTRRKSYAEASASTSLPASSPRTLKNEKLQAIFDRQEANNQLQSVSNRVNQLLKVKKKTEKELAELKQKIKQEQKSIDTKIRKTEERRKSMCEFQQFMEKKRNSVKQDREERKTSIRNIEKFIYNQNHKIALDYKNKKKKLNKELYFKANKDFEEKLLSHDEVRNNFVMNLKERSATQRAYRKKIFDEYNDSIRREKTIKEDATARKSELEKVELQLIEEISKTIEVKNKYHDSLSKIKTLSLY